MTLSKHMVQLTFFLFQSSEEFYDDHPKNRGQDLPQEGWFPVLQQSVRSTKIFLCCV